MITLATTLGCFLLLANPQPQAMPAVIFLFQSQETSPVQNPPEQAAPPDETKPAQPDKSEQPVPPAPENPKPKPVAPKKTKAKSSSARKPKKHPPSKEDPIVVVRNGGTSDSQGQISSPASDQQTTQQRKNTNILLSAATTNLQKISGKQLNPNQQDMVAQIRNYMRQSKSAIVAGDVQGANNLAVKAHLLSEELVKH